MLKPLSAFLLISVLEILEIGGLYECCAGPNVLFEWNKTCSIEDPKNPGIRLGCPVKIPVTNRSDFDRFEYELLDNQTLFDTSNDRIIQYCYSNRGDYPDASSPIYIVCIQETEGEQFDTGKFKVQAALGFISLIFIVLTIATYATVPRLLDLQGICIMHTLVGLACGYTFLGVVQLNTNHSDEACKTFAYLTYFSFTYLFFWLVTLSFHIWRTTVKPNLWHGTLKWPVIYHLFAIGGSIFFLLIVLAAHYSPSPIWEGVRPGFGEATCWFKSSREIWIYFYGPIVVLLICNVVFYLWTIVALWGQVDNNRTKILRFRFKLCVRLCIIMGITWTVEIITFVMKEQLTSIIGKVLLFLMDLLNILQGVLIFLVLVVFRKRVRRALANKNVCNLSFPSSWKYLEDEEMESAEEKANGTIVEYEKSKDNDEEVEAKN